MPGYTMPEPPAAQQSDPAADLQGLVDAQVKEQGILGLIMAVRLADGTVISKSAGAIDPAGEQAWSMDTQSALGSITKSFTAVVIMQLVEEGKLSLDDTIDTWFPDQLNGDKITVRMLLSHKSGLGNYISGDNSLDPRFAREYAPADLLAEANRLGPVDEPGSGIAHYSNTAYIVLGMIIEEITGNTWEEEVRSRIIEPLGLEDTAFLNEEGVWGGTLVPGYFKASEGYTSTVDLPSYPHYSTAWAAGGIASTLTDLLTFAGALFDGELVAPETLAKMTTPMALDPINGVFWGLGGAMVEDLPGAFGHEGGIPGYSAFYMGVPGTQLLVVGLPMTRTADIAPSLMAMQYLLALPPAGEEPAAGGKETPDHRAGTREPGSRVARAGSERRRERSPPHRGRAGRVDRLVLRVGRAGRVVPGCAHAGLAPHG